MTAEAASDSQEESSLKYFLAISSGDTWAIAEVASVLLAWG